MQDLSFWRGRRVAVALSGGVDSAVALLLLLRAGAKAEAVFMSNWRLPEEAPDDNCPESADVVAAAAAADVLKAPLAVWRFADQYRREVFAPFVAELQKGNTPNPDIFCNSRIKFRAFCDRARAEGYEAAATGHYAAIMPNGGGGLRLCKGEDSAKDQSYFLHRLTQEQLSYALFPLARLHKAEVRALARAEGLANWSRKDSTGICFIGSRNFNTFIRAHIEDNPGDICTPDGKRIGKHRGLHFHTIGQRKGIGIGGGGGALFVYDKNAANNTLQVSADERLLYRDKVHLIDTHWIGEMPKANWVYTARLRHGQQPATCILAEVSPKTTTINFATPQRAPCPGQSAVIYDGNTCLGGGIITI
ncbi:MAG: tRNA 2-thiouridine(34) synthase MnmA [Gammaproteobacteria bacterium]